MKKNIFKIQHFFFAVFVAGVMVSCQKEDTPTVEPEFTPEEQAEMAAADKFAAANSVYRALALINELPDNWESALYIPAEGVPVDEANTDIRNVISTGAEHAKNYFLSIVPTLGLNGDTWSHEGIGTLTYRAVNEDNCYAVIDVELVQMPGLKQLRFVPEALVGENKWAGVPYYGVGDVVKDKKGIYWICVRPSGGPLGKDNAYFVSFDKSLIKTTEQKQDIYDVTGEGYETKKSKMKIDQLSGKWVYAKNLVEERIAYAAAFVFTMMTDAERFHNEHYDYVDAFMRKAELLKGVFDPSLLALDDEEEPKRFFVAYGSYQSSAKKYTQVKYTQPLFVFNLDFDPDETYGETFVQKVEKAWPLLEDLESASSSVLSLTDSYDPFTYASLGLIHNVMVDKPFSVLDYAIDFMPEAQFSNLPDWKHSFMPPFYSERNVPLVMTQMSLKDHGKPVSGYEVVHVKLDPKDEPDYWGAIEYCTRYIFEKGSEGVANRVDE